MFLLLTGDAVHLSHFDMEKADKYGWEYGLSIPYTTDKN